VDFRGALEKAFDELISNERIKAAKGSSITMRGGGRRGRRQERSFIFMPRERALICGRQANQNCLTRDCSRARSQVDRNRGDSRAERQLSSIQDFLIFGDVPDLGVGLAADFAGIRAEDLGSALLRG